MVGILILIDQHITEFILPIAADILEGLKQADSMQDDIIKIQSICFP